MGILSPNPKNNKLLAALPDLEWSSLLPQLEKVDLSLSKVLGESGSTPSHVYFPTTAIISLLHVMENGASTEVSIIGNEGVLGLSVVLGGESTTMRAVVQSAGEAFRLKSEDMKAKFTESDIWKHILLSYTQALMAQISQTAACNRQHSLEQQLCRWLLASLDRITGNELIMTQDLIANMLGVRRESISEVAFKLQKAGLIDYVRGRITVINRAGLEDRVCECYAVVKAEYDRLMPSRSGYHVLSVELK